MADLAELEQVIEVAVGVIYNSQGQILITQRPHHAPHGGLWEFPGGKVEPAETILAALKRELLEEVGLEIQTAEPLLTIEHQYSTNKVRLLVYKVTDYIGIAKPQESQLAMCWVAPHELKDFNFPAANEEIVRVLGIQ